VIGVLDEDRK